MYTYEQSTGRLSYKGVLLGIGYSGFGIGKNNPAMQHVHDLGPIPCGVWEIIGEPFESPEHGHFCLRLEPAPETETFGRKDFLLHGDKIREPGTASRGCIILPKPVRSRIWQSAERKIQVVSGLPASVIEESEKSQQ